MTERRTSRQRHGGQAEAAALAYLQRRGLRLLKRNHHCRQGEIDLILQQGEDVVFVEVRYRRTTTFVHPAETVDAGKQRRIIHAARHFLTTRPDLAGHNLRFDVVAASGDPDAPELEWITSAFDAF